MIHSVPGSPRPGRLSAMKKAQHKGFHLPHPSRQTHRQTLPWKSPRPARHRSAFLQVGSWWRSQPWEPMGHGHTWDALARTALLWFLNSVFPKSFWQIQCSQASLFYNYLKVSLKKHTLNDSFNLNLPTLCSSKTWASLWSYIS